VEDRKTIPPILPTDLRAGCRVVAMSDVGCVRDENQDFMGYFRRGEDQLLIVADGMGGHSGGFEASRIAVDFIGTAFAEADRSQSPGEILATSILAANAAVRQVAANNPLLAGMGTTVVAAIIQDGIATFAHVGDSRAYLVRDGQAILITLDHSRIFRMLEAGMVHAGQIDDHPMGHILERSIGSSEIVDVEVGAHGIQLRQGDRLVLCSDGLWGMVKDPEIAQVFSGQNLKAAVEESIGMALARGADDNTTVGALEVEEGPAQTPDVVDCRADLLAANPVPPPEPETPPDPLTPITQEPAPLRGPSPEAIQSAKTRRYGAIAVGLILLVVAFLAYSKMGGSGDDSEANDPGQNTVIQPQEQEKTAAEKAELAKERETDAIARAQETAEKAVTAQTEAVEAEAKAEAADEESKEAAEGAAKEAAEKADEAEAQADEAAEHADAAKAEAKEAADLAEKEAAEVARAAEEAAQAEKEANAEKTAQAAEEKKRVAEEAIQAAEDAAKAAEDAAKAAKTESN
jgi:serine/threonine protein phosphatase PrpC